MHHPIQAPGFQFSTLPFAIWELKGILQTCCFFDAERWLSGLRRRFRKPLWAFAHPGFESLSLRHSCTLKLLLGHFGATKQFYLSQGLFPQVRERPRISRIHQASYLRKGVGGRLSHWGIYFRDSVLFVANCGKSGQS